MFMDFSLLSMDKEIFAFKSPFFALEKLDDKKYNYYIELEFYYSRINKRREIMEWNEFFLRFSLWQGGGILAEDCFDWNKMLGEEKGSVLQFLDGCAEWQKEQGELLAKKYKQDIKKIEGNSIVFIGDSITADRFGYRGIVTQAAELEATSIAFSCATSTDMFRYACEKSISGQLVSVMIGTNDAYLVGGRRKRPIVSMEEFRRNICGIFEMCKENGAQVICMTIPTMSEDKYRRANKINNKTNSNANIKKYNEIIMEEARKQGVHVVDIYEKLLECDEEEVFSEDGIHLSPVGQCILADMWLNEMTK